MADHCLRSKDYVNVIVADKQPHLVYLDMEAAIIHCTNGIGIWDWASNDSGVDPDVVIASGMTTDGYIPVSSQTLATEWPGVYALGDVATVGVPKAGTFAEGAARVVAASLLATIHGGQQPPPYDGRASCWIEFGGGRVGRVDIDFLSGPEKTGTLREPSTALVEEKEHFGSSRRSRWFGL